MTEVVKQRIYICKQNTSKWGFASNDLKLVLEIASCLEALGSMDYFDATLIFKGALKELSPFALYTMTD